MENRFDNRDFEQFVKQNADQYRMFPSEKVWKGIHHNLHTRRRWYGIGLGLLILTTVVVTWVMLSNSGKNRQVVSSLPPIAATKTVVEKRQIADIVIAPVKRSDEKTSFITPVDNLHKKLFIADAVSVPETNISQIENSIDPLAVAQTEPAPFKETEIVRQPESVAKTTTSVKQVVYNKPVNSTFTAARVNDYSFITPRNTFTKETATNIAEEKKADKKDIYPLSIESVINSYTYIKKRKKISLQVFFTPTISYRDLKENKAFINSVRNATNSTPNPYYYTDINNLVTHKPDVGMQLGFTVGYPLSKNLRLIGGLQFNVSKYDIKAYTYPSEVATIALRNTAGGTNTVSTVTNYRNAGGSSRVDWLHNLYFSASAPIGLELKLVGNKKTYFGISGSAQPTYVLSNSAYLLSTDYKNYAEIPSLIRKWNINTAFELFAGYSTGNLKWRVGPQIRYQTMSSFVKKYPVQEHLFDFGLKFGIMLDK